MAYLAVRSNGASRAAIIATMHDCGDHLGFFAFFMGIFLTVLADPCDSSALLGHESSWVFDPGCRENFHKMRNATVANNTTASTAPCPAPYITHSMTQLMVLSMPLFLGR